ncbi:MAG: hypothetical protein KDD19_29955 [Phaeodactylibacter sp.]|nr:hypothetical protein [Phaeodactylibacter sp.]
MFQFAGLQAPDPDIHTCVNNGSKFAARGDRKGRHGAGNREMGYDFIAEQVQLYKPLILDIIHRLGGRAEMPLPFFIPVKLKFVKGLAGCQLPDHNGSAIPDRYQMNAIFRKAGERIRPLSFIFGELP